MEIPATGFEIGTPAAIKPNVVPQIVAWLEEPLDSVISEITRIVYGKSSGSGSTGLILRSANIP
jgi:hypothetical protein